jgi:serine/threonine protein kinase
MGRAPSEAQLRAWLAPLLDALDGDARGPVLPPRHRPGQHSPHRDRPLLLDFGAARRVIGDMTHALTVVLKPGYAPIEQYGDVASMTQGAWTDIYALACVVYYAITGKTPMSSVERLMDDRLQPIAVEAKGRYGDGFLRAIDAALAVRPQDRPQNEAQFRALLDIDLPAPPPSPPLSGYGALSHAPFPATRDSGYSTVPGTLTPELATQVQARAPTEDTGAGARYRAGGGRTDPPASASASGPAPPAMRQRPEPGSTPPPPRVARRLRQPLRRCQLGRARPARRWPSARRRCWSFRASRSASTGHCSPRRTTARSRRCRRLQPSPCRPRQSHPRSFRRLRYRHLPRSRRSRFPRSPRRRSRRRRALSPADDSAVVEAPKPIAVEPVAKASARAASRAGCIGADRVPAASRHGSRRRPSPVRRRPTLGLSARVSLDGKGARCSDILQKGSLEPLTAEEAAYLKRECR